MPWWLWFAAGLWPGFMVGLLVAALNRASATSDDWTTR